MKILVVDDDADLRVLLRLALEDIGKMDVKTLAGGAGITEIAAEGGFDGILLDVMMPRPTGPECLEMLKQDERTKNIPVIFLTAQGGDEILNNLAELSSYIVLTKPFDPMTLADNLRVLLNKD
ncbi:MAG: response regulator [Planctomycetota bacterium]|nr:response regulator [Planctomycetota bacterium]